MEIVQKNKDQDRTVNSLCGPTNRRGGDFVVAKTEPII